jgi:pyruvate formate lyase activating enzyme
MTAESVMDIVRKDTNYYNRSGGGMTLSGGEPLEQVDFSVAIFRQAREDGIHTALDTAGNVSFSKFEAVLPYVNLVLLDIKHMDPVRHAFYTGSDNRQILDNARLLFERKIPIHIRVPIIPGVNDDETSLTQIRTFVQDQPSVLKIDFIPYHDLGLAKAASLA